MPTIKGTIVVVLERDAVLRLGVEALLESWECRVIAGDSIDQLIATIRADQIRPQLLLLPPTDGQQTGDQLASRFESEIGCSLPWIGVTGDLALLKRWKAGEIGGFLLEMPCSPEALRAAMIRALPNDP
ncbi:hypothetical protein EI613_15665 [Azospirillum sp. 412522]|nr:hypothetical protein [Azospirillum sp. 412522]MBY6263343.1 hypothetical protein [Azospirillum sp. 412522]